MNVPTSKKELLDLLISGTTKLRREIVDFFAATPETAYTNPNQDKPNKDNSIIDVTGESYDISQNDYEVGSKQSAITEVLKTINTKKISDYEIGLKESKTSVPFWEHQYVYSFSEINDATREQKEFYIFLKNQFLNRIFVDLEGNSNYTFILLFDLLRDYDRHQNISGLENQFQLLGQFYPKTKSYAVSFLAEKMKAKGDYEGAERVTYEYRNSYNYYDYWSFGNRYKTKLDLNDDEVKLLNKIYPSNNFCNIEFCCLEIIKLYLSTVKQLQSKLVEEETNFDDQLAPLADFVARKQFRYRFNSQNYRYCVEAFPNEIYSNIFKHCENAVRECYGHKRKLNADAYFTNAEVKTEFETRIGTKVKEIIAGLISHVALPDEATEIELYAQSANRWKIKFGELMGNYKNDGKQFIDDILQLGKLNRKNPSVENIFFEASKFIAKTDKEASLTLYVYYLYHDLNSATFDNKKLTKTIQKSLFKTNEQLHDFEIIIGELIKDRNLEKALHEVSKIYVVKRKKIQLDTALISEVQQQHSGTVELLNEFLQDEYEDETTTIKTREINSSELSIEITPKNETTSSSIFTSEIAFTSIHTATLEIFFKNNLTLSQRELETFAKLKGAFKNQLIDSLNEICYETLDDVLIEEEDNYFTINDNYYQKLLAK
jgi:TerB-C domain